MRKYQGGEGDPWWWKFSLYLYNGC